MDYPQIRGGELLELLSPERNREILSYLKCVQPQCHSDVFEELLKVAKAKCGEWIAHIPAPFARVLLITNQTAFAMAYGQRAICYRLPEAFHQTALRTGGEAAHEIGVEWYRFEVWRNDWPMPDLPFWTLKAYVYARK